MDSPAEEQRSPAEGTTVPRGDPLQPPLESVLDVDIAMPDQSPSALGLARDADIALYQRAEVALRRVEESKRRRAFELLSMEQAGGEVRFRRAANIRARHVPQGYEATLALRHNQRVIAPQFVQAVVRHDERCMQFLEQLRKEAQEHGFFLFPYSEEEMRQRTTLSYTAEGVKGGTPAFLIVETGGTHPDPRHRYHHRADEIYWAAQCHLHFPAPSCDALSVVELPKIGDEVLDDGRFAQYMQQYPSQVALIEDVLCVRELSKLCLASAAVNSSFRAIPQINASRGAHPITHVAAAIASLRGVRLPSGRTIMLKRDLDIAPIANARSMYLFEHFESPICTAFHTSHILKNREYPVRLSCDPDQVYHTILDWYVKVSELKQQRSSAHKDQ